VDQDQVFGSDVKCLQTMGMALGGREFQIALFVARFLRLLQTDQEFDKADRRHYPMNMRKEYDLTKLKSRPNLYAKRLKRQVTLRMRPDVIDYFKEMAENKGIPYQSLINLYLLDCMASGRELSMKWVAK